MVSLCLPPSAFEVGDDEPEGLPCPWRGGHDVRRARQFLSASGLRSSEETLLRAHPFSGPYFPDCETEQDTNSWGTSPPQHTHFNESSVSMLLRVTFKISAWIPEAHPSALFMAKL